MYFVCIFFTDKGVLTVDQVDHQHRDAEMIHSASEPQALNCEETMEDLFNKTLPTEILENVFSLLPHNDLKTVMLVCKRWNMVGESTRLWTWARFRLDLSDFENQAWPDPLGKLEVTRLQAGMLTRGDNPELNFGFCFLS